MRISKKMDFDDMSHIPTWISNYIHILSLYTNASYYKYRQQFAHGIGFGKHINI